MAKVNNIDMKDRIKGSILIDWKKINPLQPENVKIPYNTEHLKKSLLKYGFSLPFYVWKNEGEFYCIDGHHRLDVLSELIAEGHKVPSQLNAVEIEAKDRKEAISILIDVYNQKSNPFAEEYLLEFLDIEEIEVSNINVESINIVPNEQDIVVLDAQEDEFDVPVGGIETDIVIGDLFEIGEHRLLCGSTLDTNALSTLMNSQMADMVLTDPPYNVAYEGKTKDKLKIQNDKQSKSDFYQFLYDFYTSLGSFTKAGGAWYVWHADSEGANFRQAMMDAGIMVKQCLIWVKNSMVMGCQDYHWKHEPCLYGWKEGAAHGWYADRKQTTVLNFDRPQRNAEHPTMKPIPLFAYQIGNSSKQGDIVADGFAGSGTTMVACHQMERKAYVMELDPKYCQVIVDRMRKLDPNIKIKRNGANYEC